MVQTDLFLEYAATIVGTIHVSFTWRSGVSEGGKPEWTEGEWKGGRERKKKSGVQEGRKECCDRQIEAEAHEIKLAGQTDK